MSELIQGLLDYGVGTEPAEQYAKGYMKGSARRSGDEMSPRLRDIRTLMQTMHISGQRAMELLDVPEEEQTRYAAVLEQQQRRENGEADEAVDLRQGLVDYGMQKGAENATVSMIRRLSQKMNLSAEQTMDYMQIPQQERQKYAAFLEKGGRRYNGERRVEMGGLGESLYRYGFIKGYKKSVQLGMIEYLMEEFDDMPVERIMDELGIPGEEREWYFERLEQAAAD